MDLLHLACLANSDGDDSLSKQAMRRGDRLCGRNGTERYMSEVRPGEAAASCENELEPANRDSHY